MCANRSSVDCAFKINKGVRHDASTNDTGGDRDGVTCVSVMPPLVRVAPGDANNSLIFNKVHSKLVATLAPCGSPMPLPATATPLTQAEVDLISAWITAGALNN